MELTFTRAPHQAGRSLHQNMNPHFFSSLAPRLLHVVQGAKDTANSGCEAVHLIANDIAVAFEHSVFVQEGADVETFQAVRQMTLALDVLLELQKKR